MTQQIVEYGDPVSKYVWEPVTEDEYGSEIWNLVESPLDDEELMELCFIEIIDRENSPWRWMAQLGLAGRHGHIVCALAFRDFNEAAAWGLETLYRDFLSPTGQYYRVNMLW